MKTNLTMTALIAMNLALMVALMTQSQRVNAQSDATPEVLRAQAWELVDKSGQVRAQMNINKSDVSFRLRGADGSIRVKLGASEDGSGLLLLDDTTESALQMLTGEAGTSIKVQGEDVL